MFNEGFVISIDLVQYYPGVVGYVPHEFSIQGLTTGLRDCETPSCVAGMYQISMQVNHHSRVLRPCTHIFKMSCVLVIIGFYLNPVVAVNSISSKGIISRAEIFPRRNGAMRTEEQKGKRTDLLLVVSSRTCPCVPNMPSRLSLYPCTKDLVSSYPSPGPMCRGTKCARSSTLRPMKAVNILVPMLLG